MRKKKKHNINAIDIKFFSLIIVSSIIVIAIVIGLIVDITGSFNDHTYAITITDKERITEQNDSKYLIYGTDKKGQDYVFENTDNLFRGKFNSSDIYGSIKKDKTYEVTVVGYRVQFLSWYENIIKYKELKE
ncbi:MAG TPA: hypothetical protein OIL97_04390 [Oscillospiraceae bacterium]|jgi:hypothetical protein|nr:hypothetical protein [Oscillospiraceae bacterium]